MYPADDFISPELVDLINRPHKEEMSDSAISWLLIEIDQKKEVINVEDDD